MRKHQIFLQVAAALFLSVVVSCKKELHLEPISGLTVVNGISGTIDGNLAISLAAEKKTGEYYSGMYVKYRTFVPSNHITLPVKEQSLFFYTLKNYTVLDKFVGQTTVKPVQRESGTLFLMGTLNQPETLLLTKMPPNYSVTDSLLGLRFVNISPDKKTVRIRISGEGINQSVDNLAYKASTDYLPVNARAVVGDVLVEFYDQASGTLLKSYTLKDVGVTDLPDSQSNLYRFRYYTMAWLPNAADGTLAENPFLINDF